MNRLGQLYPLIRKTIPAAILVVGVGLSYVAFREAQRVDEERVRNVLEQRVIWRVRDVQDKISDATVPVEGLATFIATQKQLDPGEFHGFASVARGDDPIERLIWSPLVPGDKRGEFEAMARREDASPDFSISELDASGRLVPAGTRDEYLPIRFEERFGNVPVRLGLDRLSQPTLRDAAQRARDTGNPVLTPLFALPGEQGAPDQTVLFWPVYRGGFVPSTVDKRREAILGFASGSFRIDELFVFALKNSPAVIDNLSLFVDAPSNQPFGRPAVQFMLGSGKVELGRNQLQGVPSGGQRLSRSFFQLGRSWTLVFDYPPEVVSGFGSPAPWGYLGLGLILSLVLASYVSSQQRRQLAVESLVAERTRELNRSTAQIRGIIESSPLAMGSADPNRRIVIWNKAAERLFGYSAEEIVGTINFLAPPDEEDRVIEFARRLLTGEVFRGVESRNMRKDGTSFESMISAAAFFDSDGTALGIVFCVEDISERKQREAVERETTERLQAIVDTAVDGIIMIDAQGSAMLFNPAAEQLFGYRANEVIGRNIKMLMPPPYADEHDGYLGHYRGTGERKIIGVGREVVGRRKNGTTFPMHLSVGEARQYGQPIFVGVVHDLTAKRAADEALHQTEVLLAGIVDSSDDAIISKTLDGIVTSWNRAATKVFGYSAAEMIGRHLSVIAVPGHEDDLTAILERIRRGERVEHYETQRRRKDGSIRDISLTVSPLYDEQGRVFGASKIARDITEKKIAEGALRRSQEHLARAQHVGRIGSIEVDLRTNEVYWSDEVYRLYELERSTAGTPGVQLVTNAIHPADRPAFLEFSNTLLGGKAPAPIENRVLLRDGTIRWVRRSAEIVSDEHGVPTHAIITNQDVTERKRFEEELLRSREHLARVQNVARIGSTEVDLTTGEVIWSNEIYRLLGIGEDDIRPGVDSFAAAVHPEDRAIVREISLKGRRGEDVEPVEFRITGSDGKVKWFHRNADFVRDAEGRPIRLIATMYDVTERKSAENARRESERRFAVMFHDSPVPIWISDLSNGGRIIDANSAWLGTFGLERNEVIGRTGDELNLWPDLRSRDAMYAATMKADSLWSGEVVLRRKNGTLMDTAITIRHTKIDGLPRSIGVGIDITERKRAEAARQASEEQYRLTFDLAPLGIAHVALDGRYLLVNEKLCQMFGASREEMLATNFQSFTHPDFLASSDDQMNRLISGQQPLASWDKQYVRRDGGAVWCHITSVVKRDETGKPIHFVSTYEDITDKMASDARRFQLERQLQQSQKMEAIGQLTGGVAHDFNNLLTVMLGNLELIQEQIGEDHKVSPWIADALSAGKSGSDLTYRLLAFSRRQALEPESTDINQRIAKFVPLIRRTIGEAIEIRQKLADSVWPVMIDPSQFDSAILNLAVNARDAMPGGGWIEIATENVSVDEAYVAQIVDLKAGDFVRVAMSDAGSGMPPEIVARAFDPFFTTKEVGKGTGLGLSMVYGFIKQSGGNVTIYSEVGKGTVIRLLLPRATHTAALDTIAAGPQSEATSSGATILVVEDDAKVRAVTVAFLKSLGYRPLDAETGHEAIAILAAHPEVELLLSDVILASGETGPEVAETAKQLRPDLKVMFASGYTEDALERNGHLDPTVVLLRKPFTKSALSTKVREALGRDRR